MTDKQDAYEVYYTERHGCYLYYDQIGGTIHNTCTSDECTYSKMNEVKKPECAYWRPIKDDGVEYNIFKSKAAKPEPMPKPGGKIVIAAVQDDL